VKLFLDAGPLGQLCNSNPSYRPFQRWFLHSVRVGRLHVFVSAATNYEVRRKLLHVGATNSVERLRELTRTGGLILTTPDIETWDRASELWARLRAEGMATAADAHVDFDVVLAAEALIYGAVVITENARHLSRVVRTFTPEEVHLRLRWGRSNCAETYVQ